MLGELTKREDPYHRDGEFIRATSIHQQTRNDFQFFDQTWMSHAIVQVGVRNQGKTFREGSEWDVSNAAEEGRTFRHGDEWGNYSIVFNWGHNMPVVNDEYGYIGEWNDQSAPKNPDGKKPVLSREKHRQIMWGIYAAGGYGSTGDKTMYPEIERPYRTANWRDPVEYRDVKRLVDFFTTKGIEYWKLGTQNGIVKAGTRVYASSEPGKQYVVYAAAGGVFSLVLPEGTYTARRFDPRTGEDFLLTEIKGGSAHTFTMPDKQDWVVYLKTKIASARK